MTPRATELETATDRVTAEVWAERLARLDLDPESIELITAFLMAEVCDGIEPVDR